MDELIKTMIRVGQEMKPITDHIIREFAKTFAQELVKEITKQWKIAPRQTGENRQK